jgi:alanine dehydrogenase
MLYLSNDDVHAVLDTRTCLDALRGGYRDLARGDAAYIPRIDIHAPTGRDDDYYRWGSMSGVCRSEGVVAIRIKSDVVSWPGGLTEEKYCIQPGTYSGIILLYSTTNGEPLALINDGVLQHMRVGGSAGLGADALARQDSAVLGMMGSGGMAETYLEAIAAVRPLRLVKVFSPNADHRAAYAREMSRRLEIEVVAVDSPEEATRGSDIVSTATDAMDPTFRPEWVEPGAHVTCVSRRELDNAIIDRADVVIQLGIGTIPTEFKVPDLEWPYGGTVSYITGQPEERRRLPSHKSAELREYPSLTELETGRAGGRTDPGQVTLFINSGTQGLQFAAVAGRTYHLAKEKGLGKPMPLEWFLQDIRD